MLIGKLFVPLAMPGLAAIGLGMLAVVNGVYNAIEVVAIAVGLVVVAVAGVFTIRSNVAKIWREQAEGEKAKNEDLTKQIAATTLAHASEIADAKLAEAALQAEIHALNVHLEAARARTDLTPVMETLGKILEAVTGHTTIEVVGEGGGPLIVEGKS